MEGLLVALVALAAAGGLLRAQRRSPVLQYLFFCRYPFWTGVALLGLAPLAVFGLPSLLGNLFSLSGREILLVTWLAVLLAWVVLITTEVILCYAPGRFGVPPVELPGWLRRFRLRLFALLALPVVATAVALSPPPLAAKLGWAALGLLLAVSSLVLSTAIQVLLSDPAAPESDFLLPTRWPLFARLPRRGGGFLGRWLDRLAAWLVQSAAGSAPGPAAGRGYVNPERGNVRSGHVLATSFFAVTVVVYFLGFLLLGPGRAEMPSLGYLLLILILAGWGLPGASFLLDRYRVPTLLLLVAVSFTSSWVFNTDHYFAIQLLESTPEVAPPEAPAIPERPLPAEAFRAAELASPAGERPIVVVAASGGGITASLWAARVLTALQAEVGVDFTRSIRLISSVSGGSVGTVCFLDRFDERGPPPPEALGGIVRAAGRSSLDAAAWGLAYPDLWRVFFAFLVGDKTLDRGWAMEQAWKRELERPDALLSSWRRGVSEGWLPAAVLNATVAETGEQFLFTALDPPAGWHARDFYRTYPGHDLPVVTAARLSATFPWVSPLTRPWIEGKGPAVPGLHLGDGGYYDNFGVVTAANWLLSFEDAELDEVKRRGVLLVLIRAFPEGEEAVALSPEEHRGWLYAAVGPIVSLMNVRTSSQGFRNAMEVELLEELWRAKGLRLETTRFELRPEDVKRRDLPPLSWKLTPEQRDAILAGWTDQRNQAALARIKRIFGGTAGSGG